VKGMKTVPIQSGKACALQTSCLGFRPFSESQEKMSNRAIWNVRLRHVWLATPLKGKRLKKRQRVRIGLEEALQRKAKAAGGDAATSESES
jgi:hypothetical protein